MVSATVVYYKDSFKISRFALRDVNWLANYMQNTLMNALITKLNTGVLADDGTSNTLNGLLNQANTFAGTGLENKFPNADYFSVLRAARAEMGKTYKRIPNSYFLDPLDAAVMDDTRTTIGGFLNASFAAQGPIGYNSVLQMNKIEAGDITDGGYLIADLQPSTAQLLFNGPIEILASDSDDDNFGKDLVTIKIGANVMMPVYNTNALLKGTLADDLNTIKTT